MNVSPSPSFPLSEFIAGIPLPEEEKTGQRDYLAYCYGTGKTFGEYYVPLIADYFGLSWDCRAAILHRLSIYLRAYTIVDDDVRDIPQFKYESSLEPLRNHFLEMAWMEARTLSSRGISVTKVLENELDRYHHTSDFYSKLHSTVEFHAVDVSYTEKYADRMAMIRIPVFLLGSQSRNERLVTNMLEGVEHFMRALQILDDLVDWEEDLREGRITYPIICYLATLPIIKAEEITKSIFSKDSVSVEKSIRDLSQELPYHPSIRKQIKLSYQILDAISGEIAQGVGGGLLSKAMDIRQRVHRVLLSNVAKRTTNIAQANLIACLKDAGAAPSRLRSERGD